MRKKLLKRVKNISAQVVDRFGIRMLFSVIVVLGMLLVCWHHKWITFETNDDYYIMHYVAGFATGSPMPMPALCNYLYLKIIAALYTLSENVPWYTVIYLLIMWISMSVICNCSIKVCKKTRHPLIFGMIVFLGLFGGVYVYPFVEIQFTTVAAISGAAAIALYMSSDPSEDRSELIWTALLEVFFLFGATTIRYSIGKPVVLIFICTIILKVWICDTNWKYACFCVGISILVLFGAKYVQDYYTDQSEWRAYLAFNAEMGKWIDYSHLPYEGNEELYQSVGWGEELYALAERWFFLDENQTTEAFRILNEAYEKQVLKTSLTEQIVNAVNIIKNDMFHTKVKTVLLAVAVFLIPYVIRLFLDGKPKLALGCLAWLLGTYVLVFYFAFSGRGIFNRFTNTVFVLTITPAVLYVTKTTNLLIPQTPMKMNTKLIYPMLALTAGILLIYHEKYLLAHAANFEGEPRKTVETYAISNPDVLFVCDFNLLSASGDPFQVYPNEKPSNVISWGMIEVNTPFFFEQIKINGFNVLTPCSFLEQNVCFMGSRESADILWAYMKHRYPECHLVIVDETDKFMVFRFDM